jgi:hypothetical protein
VPAPAPQPEPDDQQPSTQPSASDPEEEPRACDSPAPVPGREVPGREVPGREVPGREVPGREVPGREVPGREVPGSEVPGGEADGWAGGLPEGLDYLALVEGLAASGALGGDDDDQDAEFADWNAAAEEGRLESCDPAAVAARAVEHMPAGAVQAGWLEVAASAAGRLDENELAGVAIAARQAASRAQAAQLAAVAQITARAAAADPKIGVQPDGRPVRVCRDAVGQIALALTLSPYGAEDWADLAVMLTWRLPSTGRMLSAGVIDLDRARLIAEVTSVLPEDLARLVEARILPKAAGLTRTQLRERLGRAVIAADPEGAEERRLAAERHADVRLHADDDQTATIVASKQPQIHAAAWFARLNAMARARKAAGIPGSLGLHRSQVMMSLMLGAPPCIPPAQGAPPDQPPPDDPGSGPAGDPASGGGPRGTHAGDAGPAGGCEPVNGGGPADGGGPVAGGGPTRGGGLGRDAGSPGSDDPAGLCDDHPAPRDEDAPPDDGLDDAPGAGDAAWDPAEDDDDPRGTGPVPAWPALGVIPPALRRPAGPPDGRPVPGLLDVLLPWTTLAGLSQAPGTLGRIGPITAAQARLLTRVAEDDRGAQWRVIITNAAGQAIAVTRLRRPRPRPRDGPGPPGGRLAPGTGLVGRITVTITQDAVNAAGEAGGPAGPGPAGPGPPAGGGIIAAAVMRTAAWALRQASAGAQADQDAGGCAHADQSLAYRPAPRVREHVIARDVTCRNPVCRQPAWRADLDHTRPYDQHGRTCRCNLGGACRRDHQLKQHPRWTLEQTRPGWFTWTTPAGRTYTVGPDTHPV